MDPHERFRQQVRGFWFWIISLVVATLGPIGAARLVDTTSTAARVAGVALGTLAWVPMMIMVWLIIRAGDEFVRRIHMLAIAIAFAFALLLLMAVNWLTRARLVDYPSYMVLWLLIASVWVAAMIIAKRYYERPQ